GRPHGRRRYERASDRARRARRPTFRLRACLSSSPPLHGCGLPPLRLRRKGAQSKRPRGGRSEGECGSSQCVLSTTGIARTVGGGAGTLCWIHFLVKWIRIG